MTERAIPERVSEQLVAFNGAVRSVEFGVFAARSMTDAVMSFADVPVGPFHGGSIRAGHEGKPPDDPMEVIGVESDGEVDSVRFRWSRDGTMTLRWEGDPVGGFEVSFHDDRP